MKNWIKKDRIWAITASIMLLSLGIGCILYILFGRQLVGAMYAGRSIEILNRVIGSQELFSVEVYYKKADRLFFEISIFIWLIIFLLFLILLIIKYKPKTIFYILIFSVSFYLVFGSTLFFREIHYWLLCLIRVTILVLNLIVVTKILFLVTIKNENLKSSLKNISVSLYSIFLSFFILEGIAMFIPRSYGGGDSFGNRNWIMRYWKPIDKFGYRDNNYDIEEVMHKKKIFILGDSLTAGYGIKNVKDRFSNLLEEKLQSHYKVFNMGSCGSGTRDAFNRLGRYPFKPDVLIFQYSINDIEEIAASKGQRFIKSKHYKNTNKTLKPLIEYSYFFNYIYSLYPQIDSNPYMDFLTSLYNDKKIMKEHLFDLNKIVIFCKRNNIPLIVVLFPFMQDVDVSGHFLAPVEKFFIEKNAAIINVTDIIKKNEIPANERIVNCNDGHPSILIHKLTAEELYHMLINKEKIRGI